MLTETPYTFSFNSFASQKQFSLSIVNFSRQSSIDVNMHAARIPDYLIVPPSIFLITFANFISYSLPKSRLPIGHPIPLEKQKLTVSKYEQYSIGSSYEWIKAFSSLAPSKCIFNLYFFAIFLTLLTKSRGIAAPFVPP